VINRTNGASNPQVTLTWNTATTSALLPPDLSKTIIARWNGTQWISEGNVSSTGNATAGTITSNVTGYGVFTLASTIDPPVAVNDTATVVQNSVLNGNVSLNDTVYETGNNWSIKSNPAHGTVTMNTNGTYTYTPTSSFYGKDSLSYFLLDAYGDTATAKVMITVTPLSKYLLVHKHAGVPLLSSDGTTFNWQYTIVLTNQQSATMDSIHVTDNLDSVFIHGITYTVTGIMASGNLKVNSLYNGSTYANALLDVSSLAGNSSDSVVIGVKVDPHGYSGDVSNQAVLDAVSTVTGKESNVLTDDPTNTTVTYPRPTVTKIPEIVIVKTTNGFSPNGDGVNDYFEIPHSSTVKLLLSVFDRSGMQVYYSDDYQNDWSGTAKNGFIGKELPNGTYFYTVTAIDKITGAKQKFSGFITLRR
jgi:gliding motility-associated-like protein